jgi:hypothetical protein
MITTGNAVFAECPRLCRVLNIGHSAKRLFAECYTRQRKTHGERILCRAPGPRQRKTLGKEYFTECRALGKGRHSANKRHAINDVILCRVSCHRHSAKRRFAECLAKTLGKMYIFFSPFCPNFFILSSYNLLNNICNLGSFLKVFAISRQFILFY